MSFKRSNENRHSRSGDLSGRNSAALTALLPGSKAKRNMLTLDSWRKFWESSCRATLCDVDPPRSHGLIREPLTRIFFFNLFLTLPVN